ncbi:retrovirus-related pol polyprotein from transposon TNT 1-94 [Tanacetum coccineum]
MIKRVYYVEGLNHNLFSVGQFCDADLEVAFRKSTCFVRDLQGNNLLTGNRGSDLYTISLQETTSSTPICFMAKASPTQAWLWHRRLSHLNFDYITLLSKKDIVTGLPKLKYVKDQLCSSCEMSKAKRSSFKSKVVRLGINPMIQPEPEDLPKDNPKLEIAVLRKAFQDMLHGLWVGKLIPTQAYKKGSRTSKDNEDQLEIQVLRRGRTVRRQTSAVEAALKTLFTMLFVLVRNIVSNYVSPHIGGRLLALKYGDLSGIIFIIYSPVGLV